MASLLETDRYPDATFTQTGQATVPASAVTSGADVTLKGRLTLHGVTNTVTIPAHIEPSGSGFTVTGSVPFRIADYGIPNSTAGGLATIADQGTFEFSLVLK